MRWELTVSAYEGRDKHTHLLEAPTIVAAEMQARPYLLAHLEKTGLHPHWDLHPIQPSSTDKRPESQRLEEKG